jgi:glutamine synthetase
MAPAFVERHGLWTAAQAEAADRAEREVRACALETVRLSFPDVHGILRGKTLVAEDALSAMRGGCQITTTLLLKDTSHRTVFPVFTAGGGMGMKEMEGAADVVMVPDPTTFRILPWSPDAGWMLCDLYFQDGRPVPLATRNVLRGQLARLADRGFSYTAGLEVEFHVFRLADPRMAPDDAGQPGTPPDVLLTSQGYQYLTELRFDQMEAALAPLRRQVLALGLPLRSVEVEFGPSQAEFTFRPQTGLDAADLMVLFRSAAKQVCRRNGYHATFMCRPRIPNVMSSGWHLHQSLTDGQGRNAFAAEAGADGPLSDLGRRFLGGLLEHARGAAAFTTPTINGYKRYRSYSLAPDRAIWGRDNRGVMVRVLGGPGDPATRLENRVGEPAANPYLYMASQIAAGLDGADRDLDPGPSADTPYETAAPLLPRSLPEAIGALRSDPLFGTAFGAGFVDYLARIKEAEIARHMAEVSEWEQREYFELF